MQSFSFNYNKSLRNYSLWFKISQRGYYLAFLLRSFGIPTNPNSNLHHHMCINSHIDNSQPNIQLIIVFYRYLFKSPFPLPSATRGIPRFSDFEPPNGDYSQSVVGSLHEHQGRQIAPGAHILYLNLDLTPQAR